MRTRLFGAGFLGTTPVDRRRCPVTSIDYRCAVKRRRISLPPAVRVIFVSATIAMGLAACGSSSTTSRQGGHHGQLVRRLPETTITLQSPNSYTPHAPAGGTDDYHCTLVEPARDHRLLHRLEPVLPQRRQELRGPSRHPLPGAARPGQQADVADDATGKGWTCFGESPAAGHVVRPGLRTRRGSRPGHPGTASTPPRRGPACPSRPAAWSSCRSTTTCSTGTTRSAPAWSCTPCPPPPP